MIKRLLPFLTVSFIALLGSYPLFSPGLPPTHDGEYHIIRFYEFWKVLQSGVWYPRWAPELNNGYGVPLFNYVYPLPNYLASFLHLIGFSFIDAFKGIMILSLLGGAIFFYLWISEFVGKYPAIAATILYIFTPYQFLDIYIRGSVGEVMALALLPFVCYCVIRLKKTNENIWIPWFACSLAMLIFAHNILALAFFGFLLSYCFFLILAKKKFWMQFIKKVLVSILLALFLSAIFWLPALTETNFVRGLQIYTIADNFPELYQLLIPSWGSGFSKDYLRDYMSLQIGIANLVVFFIAFGIALFMIVKRKKINKLLFFFLLWFALSFFLMLNNSAWLWVQIPLIGYFQFPWRLLSITTVSSAALAGFVFSFVKKEFFITILGFIPIIMTFQYAHPAFFHQRDDNYYITRSNFIDGTNSPGNVFNTLWFDSSLPKANSLLSIGTPERISIRNTQIYPTKRIITLSVESTQAVTVNIAYFPGWEVFVNGVKSKIGESSDGRIMFLLPPGEDIVIINYSGTDIEKAAAWISLMTALLILVLFGRWYFARMEQ